MAAAPVYDLAIPAPYNASFTDGERALSVASPIATAPGRTSFTLSRWMDFLGGTYTIKMLADDAAVLWVGSTRDSMAAISGAVLVDGVAYAQVYIPAGRQRLDVVLQNISVGASSCYVAFSISQGGSLIYASEGDDWLFDTVSIPDDELLGGGDERLILPIFATPPNWQNGIIERISYLTDIYTSETDAEQRRAKRRNARRSFEAGFLRTRTHRARLDNFLVGTGSERCMVPLWHEKYILPAALTTASTGVTFPTDTLIYREFREGDLVLVMNRDPSVYDVLEVATVDLLTDTITWVASPVRNWPVSTSIMPMRIARITDAPAMSNLTDRIGTVQMRFEIDEPEIGVEPSWGYCAPLFRFKVDRADAIQVTPTRRTYTLDNGVGIKNIFDPGQRSTLSTRLAVKLFGRQSVHAMRAFIAMARGAARRFYLPSNTQGLDPIGDISGVTFDVRPGGFGEYITRPQDTRILFAIVFNDSRPSVYRYITNIEPVLAPTAPFQVIAERVTINTALAPILYREIERLMFIEPSRFEQDTFEIQHLVDNSAAVAMSLMVRSSVIDEMPPIDCFVTSHPYPIETVESLQSAAAMTNGDTFSPLIVDSLESGVEITGGELRRILLPPYVAVPDELESSAEITDGTLRTLLLPPYTLVPDEMQSAAEITAGTLRTLLLPPYTVEPDEMQSSAIITGGTMT